MLTPVRAPKVKDESGLGPQAAFRTEASGDAAGLHKQLRTLLAEYRDGAHADPFGNPILRMALELTRLVDRGELSAAALEDLIRHMTVGAFVRRAERIRAYVGETGVIANQARLRKLLGDLAKSGANDGLLPFEAFRQRIEQFHYGIVFTAHPTFSISHDLACLLARLATGMDANGKPLSQEQTDAIIEHARAADHRPPAITLADEFASALDAIANGVDAVARLHETALDVARELYPAEWKTLMPRLVSLASWVGYDHDGRSDIGWADTLRMRLKSKRAQLERQGGICRRLHETYPRSRAAPTLELIESLLSLASKQVELQIEASESADRNVTERAVLFAGQLVNGRDHALTGVNRLLSLITRAVDEADDTPELQTALGVIRTALAGTGLGLTHTHFRLNATQLHNAIRHQIGLETAPSDPRRRHSYWARVNELLDQGDSASVNLGSMIEEKSSAKRMFMMLAELAKHIDSQTPIRFLIAETDHALTLLIALHFARLFRVDHIIEISPLFETEDALQRGDAIIEEALRSPHYRAYVERMGRLCVQFGYSDSGRYIGQMAASFMVERLRLRLATVLARHGLTGVQIVLFNTHGESVGRGGHPMSLIDRLRYLAPEASRDAFSRNDIAVKEESSFQGEDGYLYFLTPELAFATVCRIVEDTLGPRKRQDDAIYDDPNFASEFFAVVRQEFAGLVADPNYAVLLLGTFGRNLTDHAGSRPVARQYEYRPGAQDFVHPSQIRAIANNTILQQLGFFANTIGGVGRAASQDHDRFRFMRANSPRFGRAMTMVEWALRFSDADVLAAYLQSFDPGMWLKRSGHTRNPIRREELRAIARHIETAQVHARLQAVLRRLQADYLLLREALAGEESASPDDVSPGDDDSGDVALLHALRISMIHRLYFLASHIPAFTPHEGLTREDLMQAILRLEVGHAVDMLRNIFPRSEDANAAALDFSEPASYVRDTAQSYEHEHATIFEPLATYFTLLRQCGAMLTHRIGAIG